MDNLPTSGSMKNGQHHLPLRVYYEDTDFSGVVYHAAYLKFLERGRTEHIRALNIAQGVLFESGAAFMVRSMNIEFLKPAQVDDILLIETTPHEARGATLLLSQRIMRGQVLLITANVKVAFVINNKASRIPDNLRRIFTPF